MRNAVWIGLAMVFLTVCGIAQSAPSKGNAPAVTRDATALSLLTQSIAAMGGSTNASGLATFEIVGHVTAYGSDGSSTSKQFTERYKVAANSMSFRKELTSDKGTSVFASGGDRPVFLGPNQKSHRFGKHIADAAQPFDLPAVLLSMALGNGNYQIKFVPEGSGSPLHVQLQDQTNDTTKQISTQDWYFDPSTYLPVRVVYRLPDVITPAIYQQATCDYLGFQSAGGAALAPSQMRVYEGAQLTSRVYIDSVQFNGSFDPSFDMAEDDQQ